MARELERLDMKALFALILSAFKGRDSHDEFYEFISDTLQLDIYQEFYDAHTALAKHVLAVVKRADKDGTTLKLVSALFVRRKADPELREFVKRLFPEALPLVSEEEFKAERIRSAFVGVIGLRRLRTDPKVARTIDLALFNVDATATDLAELVAYKGMHDALHSLPLGLYQQISVEIRRFPADADSGDALREHIQQLTTLHEAAVVAVNKLPIEMLVAPERSWIGEFEQICSNLRAAVEGEDETLARTADMDLRQLLRQQPGRLNALLVGAARRIPWNVLIATMNAIAEGLDAVDLDRQLLIDAAKALESLMTEVMAMIWEHERWQSIDSAFWQAEDAFQRNDYEEITLMWPRICQRVREIREKTPGDWSADLQRFTDEFTRACPMPVNPPLDDRARIAFQRLVRSGRRRFFKVDQDIKARCEGISRLSEPLKKLVQK